MNARGFGFAILAATVSSAPGVAQAPAGLKLNQLQVIGTHNSYHAGIAPSEAKLWQAKRAADFRGLDYAHQPLTAQLDSGVRQVELDIYADSRGGLYSHPLAPSMVAASGLPADPPFDPAGAMSKSGFKVMHMQDVDYRSTCQPFVACLTEVRAWSKAHPRHVPVFLLIETKQGTPRPGEHLTTPEPFYPVGLRCAGRGDSFGVSTG